MPHYFSEPSDHEEDVVLPPSPLLHIDDTEATQSEMAPSPIEQLERHSSEETQKACFYSNLTFADMTLLGLVLVLLPSRERDLTLAMFSPLSTES